MISPRISSTRGDLGAETLRQELLAFAPPCAGRGEVVVEDTARDGELTKEEDPGHAL
jgi:hypothetical protein